MLRAHFYAISLLEVTIAIEIVDYSEDNLFLTELFRLCSREQAVPITQFYDYL